MVAVGTIIANRPPHRSVRARLRIRLLGRMDGAEAGLGIGMESPWVGYPSVEKRDDGPPPFTGTLTAAPECMVPESIDAHSEGAQPLDVAGHGVVLVVA